MAHFQMFQCVLDSRRLLDFDCMCWLWGLPFEFNWFRVFYFWSSEIHSVKVTVCFSSSKQHYEDSSDFKQPEERDSEKPFTILIMFLFIDIKVTYHFQCLTSLFKRFFYGLLRLYLHIGSSFFLKYCILNQVFSLSGKFENWVTTITLLMLIQS